MSPSRARWQWLPPPVRRVGRRILRPKTLKPVLGEYTCGGPEGSTVTVAVVCRRGFNIDSPTANSTSRLGFCHGFAQIGVRYQLVSVFEISNTLPQLRKPVVFLSVYDYLDMSKAARKVLRNYPHFVWVTPDFEAMQRVYAPFEINVPRIPQEAYRRVAGTEPNFVWGNVPPSGLEAYSDWQKLGLRLESLPLACDTTRYYPEPHNRRYDDVQIAFVGGYWPKKAVQFDKYLRPYESIVTVFGYSRWPYQGYGGLLSEGDERILYQNARVSPAISEPHAEAWGDITERAFKVMGSGGLAITDVTPLYRELFGADELLVPGNIDEYHDMMNQALSDDEFNRRFRQRGYEAIIESHTYAHRAYTILEKLGIAAPEVCAGDWSGDSGDEGCGGE